MGLAGVENRGRRGGVRMAAGLRSPDPAGSSGRSGAAMLPGLARAKIGPARAGDGLRRARGGGARAGEVARATWMHRTGGGWRSGGDLSIRACQVAMEGWPAPDFEGKVAGGAGFEADVAGI